MKDKILIVEDNADFQKLLRVVLEGEGYEVISGHNLAEGLYFASHENPKLILTDVVLEGSSGIDLCQKIKSQKETASIPVILISGNRIREEDQLQGLEEGADDYLLKPVSNEMLLAKVKAVLRRYASPEELSDILKSEGLTLDVKARKVTLEGNAVALTRKEFDLITTLLQKKGQVVYVSHLFRSIWGYGPEIDIDSHTVKVHVSSLRGKLGPMLGSKIVNVPGLGYRFEG